MLATQRVVCVIDCVGLGFIFKDQSGFTFVLYGVNLTYTHGQLDSGSSEAIPKAARYHMPGANRLAVAER